MMSRSKDTGSVSKKIIFDTEMDTKMNLENKMKPELKMDDYIEDTDLIEKLKMVIEKLF